MYMYVCLHMGICLMCVQTERQDDFHKFKGSNFQASQGSGDPTSTKTKKKKKGGRDVGWTDLWKTDALTELRIFMATFMLYW